MGLKRSLHIPSRVIPTHPWVPAKVTARAQTMISGVDSWEAVRSNCQNHPLPQDDIYAECKTPGLRDALSPPMPTDAPVCLGTAQRPQRRRKPELKEGRKQWAITAKGGMHRHTSSIAHIGKHP
jgi:hypothetical protein